MSGGLPPAPPVTPRQALQGTRCLQENCPHQGPGCPLQHRPQSARKGVVSAEICTSRTGTCGFVHFVTNSGSAAARAARPSLGFRSKVPLGASLRLVLDTRGAEALSVSEKQKNQPKPGPAPKRTASCRPGCVATGGQEVRAVEKRVPGNPPPRLQCPSPRTPVVNRQGSPSPTASFTAANGNRVGF